MTARIPQPGFGTSGHEGAECTENVVRALEAGYRHVDTAQMYDNEDAVGDALAQADVDREDVFLATKVKPENLGGEDVVESTQESLDRLGVDAVDLLYVHWPLDAYEPQDTLPAMDEVRDRGWARHVGLSNFDVAHLDEARDILDSPVVAHQVECHPWLQQDELVAYGRDHDITTVAYCPIMQGRADEDETLTEIADAHDATAHQIALAWHHQRDGVVAIPKGSGDHVEANLGASEIDLSDEEVARIDDIDHEERLVDPDAAVWNR
ncbi:aldo/keto reductase, diketogulonate reductase [Halovivax ruber XH-70]|uniref:Aldo/keto reductase, diketogulonate reductase n=1 Tax=Halovivax ruber (strain DSM 18193 / JCM 13892 / XH-70) TaxID=797302 RepID=L0I830_HALRX|nr:aldo/keto reductase [Halovivax ruber]AGB14834.1 aldo/keto reductase, diketogulonate reductase [Halovivax ruber XH-70]